MYIETSVIADWLFVATMLPRSRRKLRKGVHLSYQLLEQILKGRFQDEFVTSFWAILEAVGALKRSRIEFNMLTQNINLGYYHDLKDKSGFKIDTYQVREIVKLVDRLDKAHENRRLIWSQKGVEFTPALRLITIGLDPPDAIHVVFATIENCDFFVTKDNDFLKRKDTLSKYTEVLSPATAFQKLNARRRTRNIPDIKPMPR